LFRFSKLMFTCARECRSKQLNGQVAIVTGGTTGIGHATAAAFLKEGARVIVTGTNEKTIAAAKTSLAGAEVVKCDVTDLKAIEAFAEHVKKIYGHVDVLFANAGIAYFTPTDAVDEKNYDSQFDSE
jgi:NAD(P)-dependent dehydrogenase (short-subunit alcohol dehydrogenase family)